MEEKEEEKFSFDVLLYNQWICTTEFLDLEVTLLVTHWFTCYKCFIDIKYFLLNFFSLCFVLSIVIIIVTTVVTTVISSSATIIASASSVIVVTVSRLVSSYLSKCFHIQFTFFLKAVTTWFTNFEDQYWPILLV